MRLYYLSPNTYGGWATFTAHLMKALGWSARLYKVGRNTERHNRPFGYGVAYRNLTLHDAVHAEGPKLIVAAAKRFRDETAALVDSGAWLVVHDPTELKNIPATDRVIVIRRSSLVHLPHATFIRHPYVRHADPATKSTHAVSTARIDYDKHTEIILRANKLLPPGLRIQLYGWENRLYGKHKLMPEFPEWVEVQSKQHFSRDWGAVMKILGPARYSVDMSEIKGDGGGTQYTFLEAWDAGAVPVINRAWLREEQDDMIPGYNCIAVHDHIELAEAIKATPDKAFVNAGHASLEKHSPEVIARAYKEVVGG